MLTPITISAPILRHCSAGKFFTSPPSAYNISSIFTGSNNTGMAIDALRDLENTPLSSTAASPLSIFVATQANGIGRLLKSTGSE